MNILYCPYKSEQYWVRESESLSCSTIVCNWVDTGEIIKCKRKYSQDNKHLELETRIKENVFSFYLRALSLVGSQRCVFFSHHSTIIQDISLVGWFAVDTTVLSRSHVVLMQAHSQLTIQLVTYSENM